MLSDEIKRMEDDASLMETIDRDARVTFTLPLSHCELPPLGAAMFNELSKDELLLLMKSKAFELHIACFDCKIEIVTSLICKLEALHHVLRKKVLEENEKSFCAETLVVEF